MPATPVVNVTHPAPAAPVQEIVLPGNTAAFTDSPIYARTDGYLTHWRYDIGARVNGAFCLSLRPVPFE